MTAKPEIQPLSSEKYHELAHEIVMHILCDSAVQKTVSAWSGAMLETKVAGFLEHHFAARAPEQEPSVPLSKLKAWRNAASIPLTYSDTVAFDALIHAAEKEQP